MLLLRGTLIVCQTATILISWQLWQTRSDPPALPAVPLPSLPMAIPLLVSLVVVLRYPLVGAIAHAALLTVSFGMDQTRLQPEVVSMAILLFATTGRRALLLVGRTHLVTLWFWAGLAKLISDRFVADRAAWMLDGLPVLPKLEGLAALFGVGVIALEIGAGIFAIPVRTRKLAVVFAIGVHFGALLSLGPLGHNWNHIIWPWNIALAVAAIVLIGRWRRNVRAELGEASWPARVGVAFLTLFPAAYYAGAADAYLSHHLYSEDTATAFACDDTGRCKRDLLRDPLKTIRAPLPPEHRLFRALFDATCERGQILVIRDPRGRYASDDWERVRRCPTGD